MHRRGLLRLLGLAAAGLAGCAGSDTDRGEPPTRPSPAQPTPEPTTPTPEPTPSPTPTPDRFVDGLQLATALTSLRVTETGDGHPQAIVPVENTTDRSLDATLAVTVRGSGDEYSADTDISVPAGQRREYSVTFDVTWDSVAAESDPSVREVFLYNPAYRS